VLIGLIAELQNVPRRMDGLILLRAADGIHRIKIS